MGNKTSKPISVPNYTNSNNWVELTPFIYPLFGNPVNIDRGRFLIIPFKTREQPKPKAIYVYNISKNVWRKFTSFYYTFGAHSAILHKETKTLYAINHSEIIHLNVSTFNKNVKKQTLNYAIGVNSKAVIIDNLIHIVGGWSNPCHLTLDLQTYSINKIYKFKEYDRGFVDHELVYIKSKHILYMFGGRCTSGRCFDLIYSYSFINNKWTKWNIFVPRKLFSFCCILSRNEKYIIIFGGMNSDRILIFDVNTKTITASNIKCPANGSFTATSFNNSEYSDVLVNGYIKKVYKKFMSKDISDLINLMCYSEIVYLLQYNEDGKHWKIDLQHILGNNNNIGIDND